MTGHLHWIIVLKPMLYIYIDFHNAFDSVFHAKLLAKLESYNIRGDLLAASQTTYQNTTLFLLYINDLANGFAKLDCSIALYTDDAQLYSSFKIDFSPAVDEALEYITKWTGIWQLQIANIKCFAHRISRVTSASTYDYRKK